MSHRVETQNARGADSRRSFLRGAGVVSAGALGGALLTPSTTRADFTFTDAYLNLSFHDIENHTRGHVMTLQGTITEFGGTPRPQPVFQIPPTPTLNDFKATLKLLLNLSVGAYLDCLRWAFNPQVRLNLSVILAIQARHAGWVNTITPSNIRRITASVYGQEQTWERVLTRDESVDFYMPFHATLNGGPPMFYGAYSNAANDINLLNYMLGIEFLLSYYLDHNKGSYFPPLF
jgi:hypothetical protein